jgi:hypothetical protein
VETLRDILTLFSRATSMQVDERKSTLSTNLLSAEEVHLFRQSFPFADKELDVGLKYLGFNLKPNAYRKVDRL